MRIVKSSECLGQKIMRWSLWSSALATLFCVCQPYRLNVFQKRRYAERQGFAFDDFLQRHHSKPPYMRLKASLFSDADKANQQDIPVDLSHYPTVLPAAQESDDTLVQSTYNFISALQSAISCKDVSPISTFLNKNVQWSSPVVKSGKDLLQEQLPGFLSFFYDPKLQVFAIESVSPSERKVKVRYQLSFWYPFPWRPRIIVPATATISFETDQRTILSVDEAWDITLFDILLKQIPPRFWDIWHVFSIPVPEYPPVTNIVPLKPLQKEAISVVRLPESILYQAVWYAPKSLFGPPLTVIPGFSLYGRIGPAQGKGAEPYYTVKNVEVSSSRFLHPITGEEMKLYRWRMHVPTCLQDKVLSLVQSRTKLLIEGDSLLGDDDGNEISIASSAMDNTSSINVTDFEVENGYEPGSPLEDQVRMEPSVGPLLQHQQESGNDQQESDAEEGKDIRGTQYALTEKQMEIYEANQHTFGSFIYQRPRLMAQILLKGEVDSNRIAQTWKRLRESIEAGEIRDPQTGRPFRAKAIPKTAEGISALLVEDLVHPEEFDTSKIMNYEPLFTLQTSITKCAFNSRGEPAMAVYEMQYGFRETAVMIDVEIDE